MPKRKEEPAFAGSNILLILALLEDEDKYGYQIIRELECRSDKTFSMKEGTLYPILHGLEERGEVRSYERESEAGRRRRYYKLTRQGVKTLARCRQEWQAFCRQFGKVVGGEACVVL
ncbi:helix-turn-helix transcriptional regulator [Butyricicoccus faecihominis]|uniref:PadR family transcriptional regulator n=1 Tax=Butyricicoccaceae TaxID=3085642 RepID=UPI0024796DC2|nr:MULTISPECIES: helix-turn-helix transcriptional regulator [Butyricicoccaceae]MCQ5128459.1 helix-turn-helix transcriptional regulator [Butyricicoccus faecihominis]WNX83290.1 helix-turn-helix transcriptional regulator [Agathobaculum sp. NTUH-O15-33]